MINISKGKYKIKFWNSGKSKAYNVNFEVKGIYGNMILKEKVPYETLESGKSFEERIMVADGSPNKFEIITTWENGEGKSYSKTQIVSM